MSLRKPQTLEPNNVTSLNTQNENSTDFTLIIDHRTSMEKQLEIQQNADDAEPTNTHCETLYQNVFRKKNLYRLFPICQWLPRYTRSEAFGDLIAGITVGLTVIPQGLAYSGVAGLPTEYGLYGAFMGCFVYVLMGTCKDSTIGSTAIASLLVYQFAQGVWQRAVLLTFITGIIEVIMAIFRLGFLAEFVSKPVSAGFTSAVALIICTSQVKDILGIRAKGVTFLQRWISMIGDIHNTRIGDSLMGFFCMCFLIAFRYIGRIKIRPKESEHQTLTHRILNKFFWFLGVTRNATVVIICGSYVYYLEHEGKNMFRLTGYVPPGLPEIGLPPFKVPGNETAGIPDEGFFDMIEHLGYGLVFVPLIAFLENISVCKAFSKGKAVDSTQELLTIGIANILNSFCKGYRANAGLGRSSVNNASGVRTPLGNLYIGIVVMLALLYLTELFHYIPKAALAAIIITAVIFQLQYDVVVPMWRSKRSDLIPGFVAFIACLVMPLEIGILIAIGVNLMFILYNMARPKIELETFETSCGIKFLKLTPDRCLIFPSVEFVRNLVLKSGTKTTLPVVIDCTYIYGADFTAANVISSLIEDFNRRNQKIIFFNLKPSVVQIFQGIRTKLVLCYNTSSLLKQLRKDTRLGVDRSLNEFILNGNHKAIRAVDTEAQSENENQTESKTANDSKSNEGDQPEIASNASTITLSKM